MDELKAAQKADGFIALILQHQEHAFGKDPLHLLNSQKAAVALANFRKTLIEELKKQDA